MPFSSSYKRKKSAGASGAQGARRKVIRRKIAARPYRTIRGRGAYYVTGGGSLSGSLGPFKGGGHVNYGYSQGGAVPQSYIAPKVSGLGAYSISSIKRNVLIKPGMPMVANAIYAEGGTIVRHREYLGAIVSSPTAGQFKATQYHLNPAQSFTFPWLSTIAANYEEYKPNGVYFEFRSTCSDAIASSTDLSLGQVMMCTQYDPTDPPFTGESEMLNYFWSQNGKVSNDLPHFIECDPAQSPLSHYYTREGANQTSTDLRFSDFGTFTIATKGLQGTSVHVGQLWVSYEFIFYKPKLGSKGAEAGGWYHADNAVGVIANAPFGTIANVRLYPENNLGVAFGYASPSGNRIVFPKTNIDTTYLVYAEWTGDGSDSALTPPTFTTNDGQVKFVKLNVDDTQIRHPIASALQTLMGVMVFVSIEGDSLEHWITLVMADQNMPDEVSFNLYVSQIPWHNPVLYQ